MVEDPLTLEFMYLVERAQAGGDHERVLWLVRERPSVVWRTDLSAELLQAVRRSDAEIAALLRPSLRENTVREDHNKPQAVPPGVVLDAAIDCGDVAVLEALVGEGSPCRCVGRPSLFPVCNPAASATPRHSGAQTDRRGFGGTWVPPRRGEEGALRSPVTAQHVERALGTGLEAVSRVVAAAFQAAVSARERQRRREERGPLLTFVDDTVELLQLLWAGPT